MEARLETGYAYCVVPQHAAVVFLAVAERLGFALYQNHPCSESAADANAIGEGYLTTRVLTQLVLQGDIEQLQHFLFWWDAQLSTKNTGLITRKPID